MLCSWPPCSDAALPLTCCTTSGNFHDLLCLSFLVFKMEPAIVLNILGKRAQGDSAAAGMESG